MEEATTTSSAPTETTPVGTSSGSAGIATSQPATGAASSAPAATTSGNEQPSEQLPPLDLKGIPKEFHKQLKAAHEKINNDFRSNYTQKYQSLAAEKMRWAEREKEFTQKEQQFQQLQAQIREALVDENKYREYRARLGYQNPQPQTQEPVKAPETVGDLMKIIEQQVDQKINGIRGYADQRTNQSIEGYARQTRWEAAEAAVKTDPVFQKYSDVLTQMALADPKYRQMYDASGRTNEAAVMNKVLQDFKDRLQSDRDEARQQTLQDLEKKKAQSTLAPTNVNPGSLSKPSSGPKDARAMIEAAKAKIGWTG